MTLFRSAGTAHETRTVPSAFNLAAPEPVDLRLVFLQQFRGPYLTHLYQPVSLKPQLWPKLGFDRPQ
jgi:hypothetical protein